ncbi:MAG: lipopolysaccharide kinase InaA family protein, partial [Lentisphaerae bacterium]|nr:lipopolysaccharide kinase InaA family protein [Lentisphaerota bacterium]
AAHTDNLFVERVTEPETFDHRILGRAAAGLLRFNLIRKARLLQDIGRRQGLTDLYCTHTAWSLRRIARLLEQVEEKQADYLARYLLLAAASGALRRVYWGPLIGQREGLIDDGTTEYPDPPHVTFYGRAPGDHRNYRLRPAFHAMAAAGRMLDRATFIKAHTPGPTLEILEFQRSDGTSLHAVWTVNTRLAAATDCYSGATLAAAEAHDRDGRRLGRIPEYFGESPVYLSWPAAIRPMALDRPRPLALLRFNNSPAQAWQAFQPADGTGMKTQPKDAADIPTDECLRSLMQPAGREQKNSGRPERLLRDGRNRVWRSPAPWKGADVIIKQFRVPGPWRRLLDIGKPGKAVRSWNNSQELLRRGLATPQPLAFFQPDDRRQPGFFICADYRPDCSVRDVFTALAARQTAFRNLAADEWYRAIAAFLVKMHRRGVFFRDLSAGNLLVHWRDEQSAPDFSLIDTARARFRSHP